MKKLLIYMLPLMLTLSCSTSQHTVTIAPKVPDINLQQTNEKASATTPVNSETKSIGTENNTSAAKPVVLKRIMRRPAVI